MNNVKRLLVEVKEEEPQLHVVVTTGRAAKRATLATPLVLPSPIHARRRRPELDALGWNARAPRLTRGQ
jgi:hypothetical protein